MAIFQHRIGPTMVKAHRWIRAYGPCNTLVVQRAIGGRTNQHIYAVVDRLIKAGYLETSPGPRNSSLLHAVGEL